MGSGASIGFDQFQRFYETLPLPAFGSDADGGHRFTNRAYQAYTGLTAEALLGIGFVACVHPDDRPSLKPRWDAIRATEAPWDVHYRMRRHDGVYRWHRIRGEPVFDASGRLAHWMGTCTDVDDSRTEASEPLVSFDRVSRKPPPVPYLHSLTEHGRVVYREGQWLAGDGEQQPNGALTFIEAIEPLSRIDFLAAWRLHQAIGLPFSTRVPLHDPRQATPRDVSLTLLPQQGARGIEWRGEIAS